MSGGRYEYSQYKILEIIDYIKEIINKNGKKKTNDELKEESWRNSKWYEQYPEDLYHYKYPDEIIEKMKEGVKQLQIAYVYAQRIDWLLSGDDGEETFLTSLKKELDDYEKISL